jgi:osmotically-inducible protein OsmY
LHQDVLAAPDHDEDVIPVTIGVEVHHAIVKLAGLVSTEIIRQRAEIAAREAAGVSAVVMDIAVVNLGDALSGPEGN